MVQLEERATAVRFQPGGWELGLAVAGMIGAWSLVLGGLIGIIGIIATLSNPWPGVALLAVLCLASATAVWATRQVVALRRVRAQVPEPLLRQRQYGDLAAIEADEGRPLRPVGMAISEVVGRTDALLSKLIAIPSMRIFRGVRPPGAGRPVATHAVSAGRQLILLESVAWPPGSYRMDPTGRVCCDGEYIGQTIRSLSGSVSTCRGLLPRSHQVSALVVVHRTGPGDYALPAGGKELGWALADDLPRELQARLGRQRSTVSRHIIAALTEVPAATSAFSYWQSAAGRREPE